MATFVYALCTLTSVVCFALLLRQYIRVPQPLLALSAIGFLCFAVANGILFIDLVVFPHIDLKLWRTLATLLGVAFMLAGLINSKGANGR